MVASVPLIELEPNVWVNANTETGFVVGSAMQLQNLGSYDVEVVKKASEPTDDDGPNFLAPHRFYGSWLDVASGEPDIWLRCKNKCRVSVQQ